MIETIGEGKSAVATPDGKSRKKKKKVFTDYSYKISCPHFVFERVPVRDRLYTQRILQTVKVKNRAFQSFHSKSPDFSGDLPLFDKIMKIFQSPDFE